MNAGLPPPCLVRTTARVLAVAGLVVLGAGCAGTAGRRCEAGAEALFAAPADTLGIDPFLRFDPEVQADRRARADELRRQAGRTGDPVSRLRLLMAATTATPDDPDLWLATAGAWRALGDQLQTAAALDGAAAAVRRLNDPGALLSARGPGYRREAALATSLARAWLHYERAEWNEADDWAGVSLQIEPASLGALQIRGLIQGRLGQTLRVLEITAELRRLNVFSPYLRWIMGVHDQALDRGRGALNGILDLRPQTANALECYRDMGEIAERLGEWSLAQEWYGKSAAASPLSGSPCLRRLVLDGLDPQPDGRLPPKMPVWVALDHHYVTGSLPAYIAHAFEQFDTAAPGPERDLWAGLAVNAAGIQLRRQPGLGRALRVRGLVFAATGKDELAFDDLRRAAAADSESGRPDDARVEAELGRLYLGRADLPAAVPHLRRAVALDRESAPAWADLGMALATAGDREGALDALSRSIALAPDRPTAWYNRGLLHMHAGRLTDAESDLARAAQLAPGNADIARLLQQVRLARTQGRGAGAKP